MCSTRAIAIVLYVHIARIIFSGYANNCRVRRNKEVTRLQQTCDELDVEQKKTDIAFVAKMEREIGRQQEDLAAANTSSSRKQLEMYVHQQPQLVYLCAQCFMYEYSMTVSDGQ
jgi:hypothetical protein